MINDHFATMALEHADKLLDRSHRITRGNLATLSAWVDTPLKSHDFCVDLLEKTGVMLTPGDAFDMEGYARIGFANDPDILRDGLAKLGDYLEDTK